MLNVENFSAIINTGEAAMSCRGQTLPQPWCATAGASCGRSEMRCRRIIGLVDGALRGAISYAIKGKLEDIELLEKR